MDEKINKADKKPFIIVGIIIVLLIICIVCLLAGKLGKSKTEDLPPVSERAPISEKANGVLSGDSRFLVVASEGMHTKIDFMFLIDFKVYSEKIIITKLSRDTVYNGSSYAGEYAYGGIDSLISAVEGNRQIEIDRYAIINKNGFSELTDTMGSVMLNVIEPYTYQASDKVNQIPFGENELQADMLYTYLSLLANKNYQTDYFTQTVCDIVNMYMKDIDVEDSLDMFSDISNCITSNLTVEDYYSSKADIEYLITNNTVCVPPGE